jgi:hypothetical protein
MTARHILGSPSICHLASGMVRLLAPLWRSGSFERVTASNPSLAWDDLSLPALDIRLVVFLLGLENFELLTDRYLVFRWLMVVVREPRYYPPRAR